MRSATHVAALALLALAVPAAAQQSAGSRSNTLSGGSQPFSGLYRTTQRNGTAACAPRPLPPPAPRTPRDTADYVPATIFAGDSVKFWIRHTHDGSRMTAVVSMDSLGRDAMGPFTGTLRPDGTYSISRTLALGPEGGPRQGGRRFFLEQVMNVRGKFEQSPTGVREAATGTAAYRFHADSAGGAVFTTCTVSFTGTGTRVGP